MGEGEESNSLEIICLTSFTIRLHKSLRESLLQPKEFIVSSPFVCRSFWKLGADRYSIFSEFKAEISSELLNQKFQRWVLKLELGNLSVEPFAQPRCVL